MTVCIAAICDGGKTGGKAIVTASDRKISTVSYSADAMAIKVFPFKNDWGAFWASEDISEIPPIVYAVQAACESKGNDYAEMVKIFNDAIQRNLRERASQRVLAPFDLTIERFLAEGSAMFPKKQYTEMFDGLMSERLKTDFLVFGFDKSEQPHLFSISDYGDAPLVESHDLSGFAAIGSGSEVASSSMFFHGYNLSMKMEEAVYLVCQAKFMSETAEGVGRDTFAFVHRPRENSFPLMPNDMEKMRKYWERKGKPRIPRDALTVTSKILDSSEEFTRKIESDSAEDRTV